jgi:hypothetical protein
MAIRFSGSDCFPCPYSTGLALLTGESVVDRENTKSFNNPAPGTLAHGPVQNWYHE